MVSLQVAATDDDSGVQTIEAPSCLIRSSARLTTFATGRSHWAEQNTGTCAFNTWNAWPLSQAASFSVNTALAFGWGFTS